MIGFDDKDRPIEVKGLYFELVSSDDRRKVFANTELLDGKEISIIKLEPGKAIGGCIHEDFENYLIIKGIVEVWIGKDKMWHQDGDSGIFPEGVPHAFVNKSKETAIIMEYGTSPEDKKAHDPRMREEVNKINKNL